MQALLRLMGRAVARHPGLLLAVLAVVTMGSVGLASQLDVETDITAFAADTELSRGFDLIEEEFGGRGTQVQVIVDAGPGGNVLTPAGFAVAERIEDAVDDAPAVADRLAPDGFGAPAVVSFAGPFSATFAGFDVDVDEVPDTFAAGFVDDTLGQVGDRIEGLLSNDLDLDEGTARAGLVVVGLDPELDDGEIREASLALRDALDRLDTGWFDVHPFSFALLTEDIEEGLFEDLPVLMAASFLLVLTILWLLFRRVSDVALGVTAMGLAIIWMAGGAAVLGPSMLGLTGEFNQIAVAVPVLLVGLGIDYTVHLVARYRENLATGHAPPRAAEVAIRTVGVALVLATVTTVAGFLSNLVTPLPPIADFGVFAAVGIVAAFVVTGLLVPGVRALLDRRRRRSQLVGSTDGHPSAGGGGRDGVQQIGELLGRLSTVAVRAPVVVLVVAAGLAGGAAWLASDLGTEFSQEDFIPDDSEAGRLIDLMDARFGGDVSERTQILVEADLEDPAVLDAMLKARERMSGIPDVVTSGGVAEVTAVATLVELIVDEADDARDRLADQLEALADPDQAAADLPLPVIRGPEDLPDAFRGDALENDDATDDEATDDDEPGGLLDDTEGLEQRLPPGVDAEDALLRALPADDLDSAIREAVAEQLREDRPAGVSDAVLEAAAALATADLDRTTLIDLGFPVEELDEDTLDLLDTATELGALGWRDGGFAADADIDGIYAVLRREAEGELDAVVAPDRQLGLLNVSTTAGQPRAEALAERLDEALAPLVAAGADVLIASEPLLIEETLATLADAQTNAIVISLLAAALLMIGYYWIAERRPALGAIAVVPSLLAVVFTLGSMRVLGLTYNALTATVASIAIGIGVPYGIHVTNRFLEERARVDDPEAGVLGTIRSTGAALVGSAVTTASAFGVLGLSNLVPLRQFGIISAIVIVFALLSALVAESSCLVLWDRYRRRRDGGVPPRRSGAGEVADERGDAAPAAPVAGEGRS